jgi:hypothetical protein
MFLSDPFFQQNATHSVFPSVLSPTDAKRAAKQAGGPSTSGGVALAMPTGEVAPHYVKFIRRVNVHSLLLRQVRKRV